MHPKQLLDAALDAAGRGWHVFPLRPNDKRPAFPDHLQDQCTHTDARCRTGHVGWEGRATVDPDRIRRGWATVPYSVGIACGPSGLVVIDLDVRKPDQRPSAGCEGYRHGLHVFTDLCHAAGQPVPDDTYTVTTGTGGIHLYFRHPTSGPALRNTAGQRGTGLGWLIDTRAHGGYVVAAGSTVAGRPYTITRDSAVAQLPAWLAERLTPTPPAPRPVTITPPTVRAGTYVDAAIRRQLGYLHQAAQGERNHVLYVSAIALGQLAAGGALTDAEVTEVLAPAARAVGLTDRETTRTIRSGLRAGARRPRRVT